MSKSQKYSWEVVINSSDSDELEVTGEYKTKPNVRKPDKPILRRKNYTMDRISRGMRADDYDSRSRDRRSPPRREASRGSSLGLEIFLDSKFSHTNFIIKQALCLKLVGLIQV